jgi:hypothetical protein
MLFFENSLRLSIVIVAMMIGASGAIAATQFVVVVDPSGHPVQSEIYRVEPSPEKHLGRTDPQGRLLLEKRCAPTSYLRANPSADYYAQGAYCSADNADVRIEVTPVAVIARLISNMKAARDAGNQAAVAQAAAELDYRSRVRDSASAGYYRNVAIIATATLYSPDFSKKIVMTAHEFTYDPGSPTPNNYRLLTICTESDLITCAQSDSTAPVFVHASPKLKRILSISEANALDSKGIVTYSNDWLKSYSMMDRKVLVFKDLSKDDFMFWKAPDAIDSAIEKEAHH